MKHFLLIAITIFASQSHALRIEFNGVVDELNDDGDLLQRIFGSNFEASTGDSVSGSLSFNELEIKSTNSSYYAGALHFLDSSKALPSYSIQVNGYDLTFDPSYILIGNDRACSFCVSGMIDYWSIGKASGPSGVLVELTFYNGNAEWFTNEDFFSIDSSSNFTGLLVRSYDYSTRDPSPVLLNAPMEVQFQSVPEPGTLPLLALGLAGLVGIRKFRKSAPLSH